MNKHLKYKKLFDDMKEDILLCLSKLELGYGMRKWEISEETDIPKDILTVLLKELKYDGKIELIMIWSCATGNPNGSGYCIKNQLKQ